MNKTVIGSMILALAALFLLIVSTISLEKTIGNQKVEVIDPSVLPEITPKEEEKKETKKEEKMNEYEKLEAKLENTAKTYVSTNNISTDRITSKELIEKEYLNEMIDPKNKKYVCNGYVTINNDEYNSYIRCYDPECEDTEDKKCENSYQTENYNQEFE